MQEDRKAIGDEVRAGNRIPFWYPSGDPGINSCVESEFAHCVSNKMTQCLSSLHITSDIKGSDIDPIFGEVDLSSLSRIPPSYALEDEVIDDMLECDIDEYHHSLILDQTTEEIKQENPFAFVDKSRTEVPNITESFTTYNTDFLDQTNKDLKMSDWLEQADRGWLDNVLVGSTNENIYYDRPTSKVESIIKSSFYDNLKKENSHPRVDLYSSFRDPEKQPEEHKKSFNIFKKSNKKRHSLPSDEKPGFWKKLFGVSKSDTKKEPSPLKKAHSINQTQQSNSLSSREDNDQKYYFVYSISGDKTPFRSKISKNNNFTLKDAKHLIPNFKDKHYRLFFKTMTFSEGREKTVFDEITENDQKCPFIGNEIICKIFKS